ncbi:MAG TPA: hypothetical protein VLA61_20985 [Ideonella sp.]|uniref:hypothetical protein n=2 Tax=Ideonella sp. TaxID=1929293 RepID=UPI002B9AF660|nr:hypothetical protein [Ideonella sp.]HSI50752.1 hypothetical protein [Ideonella sp.]
MAAAALACLMFAAASAQAAPTYRIKDLGVGPDGYSSQGLAINDQGTVVGWIQKQQYGDHYAVAFQPDGSIVFLGALPGDTASFATGINNLGQIVGYSGPSDSPGAFLYDPVTGMQALGSFDPAHRYSMAAGISDNGTVVGQSNTVDGVPHAFTWTAATGMVDPFPKKGAADASGINASGQWVGHYDKTDATIGVRVSAEGKVNQLGAFSPLAPYSYGKGINSKGQVAGYSADPDTFASRAFLWDKKKGLIDIGVLPGGLYSNALKVNDAGQVVGIADKPARRGSTNVPFYYDKKTGMVDVSTLIDPADPLYGKVQFDAGQGINNHGVIVTNGIQGEDYHAYLLIPVE